MKIQQAWDRIQSQFQAQYATTEVVGSAHGDNRLGGNSSSGLRGFRPRNKRSMWQVRVGRRMEGHFSRHLPVE